MTVADPELAEAAAEREDRRRDRLTARLRRRHRRRPPVDHLGRNTTPAMAAGVSDHVWTAEDIAALLD